MPTEQIKPLFKTNGFDKNQVPRFLEQNPEHKNKDAILDELQIIEAVPKGKFLSGDETGGEALRTMQNNLDNVNAIISAINEMNRLATED